jgi:hypothetical protein
MDGSISIMWLCGRPNFMDLGAHHGSLSSDRLSALIGFSLLHLFIAIMPGCAQPFDIMITARTL